MTTDSKRLAALLAPLAIDEALHTRVEYVLTALPRDVRSDFTNDPSFRIALDDFVPGRGRKVWLPSPDQSRSRCVVLKRRLAATSEAFAHYIIAHELAHAFLNNGSWGDISDPELAADALARQWGFVKPDA